MVLVASSLVLRGKKKARCRAAGDFEVANFQEK